MDFPSRGLRRTALLRIASLATVPSSKENTDLERLAGECPPHPNEPNGGRDSANFLPSQVPLSARELEVLLSLCRASPLLQSVESAEKLLYQLVPYMSESYCQRIMPSPLLSGIDPSPWECLTSSLTVAVLLLGLNFPKLRYQAKKAVESYLENVLRFAESEARELEALTSASVVVSFIGFLESAATHSNFWTWEEQSDLISKIKTILSEDFMISVESTFSTIRNSHNRHFKLWKRYTRHYAAIGRPLGSMLLHRGFMRLILSCSSMYVANRSMLEEEDILDILMRGNGTLRRNIHRDGGRGLSTIELMAETAAEGIALIDDGTDYLQLGTAWQQRLAFSAKAFALATYCICLVLAQNSGHVELLAKWLEVTMEDSVQMADETLATVTLKVMAILSEADTDFAASLSRTLPRFIVRSSPNQVTVRVAARCLAHILQYLSQDAIITTLYTLVNVLSSGSSERGLATGTLRERLLPYNQETLGSAISLALSSDEEKQHVYSSVIEAVVVVARTCDDDKIIALAQSILIQKIEKLNSAVDMKIVVEVASLALVSNTTEFKSILKLYSRLSSDAFAQNNQSLMNAVLTARTAISSNLTRDSALFEVFLADLLEGIVSKGEVHDNEPKKQFDQEIAAREISQLLLPLARLLNNCGYYFDDSHNPELLSLCRNAWYNCVVHGFGRGSELAKRHDWELRAIAKHSPPLISDTRVSQLESDMELNTVLRRGMTAINTAEHKKKLIQLLPAHEGEIRSLTYPKVIFLETAFLLESLRAGTGDCSKVLSYFVDPNLKAGETATCMVTIANDVTNIYLNNVRSGIYPDFSAEMVAKQLVEIFTKCCHRVEKVHSVALICADKIVATIPSALCHRSSVYAMLELLTLMWSSCLDEELDEYTWRSTLTSERAKITIELSDSYASRRKTLKAFHTEARNWMSKVLNIAPMDVKGLLQTYLSEHDEIGDFGNLALGRSFALEMGSQVPISDQRLVTAEQLGDCDTNCASDFILQYTIRQGYRHAEPLPEHKKEWLSFMHINENIPKSRTNASAEVSEAELMLSSVHLRALEKKYVSIAELRDVLRRAASVLCRTKQEHNAIIHHLVGIPFALFSTQAIELGISLWVGVMHENVRFQSRILVEIAHHWEITVRKRIGLFSDRISTPDAFGMKMEYAPSDKNQHNMEKREILSHIVPHQKILSMLSSHFHACRLGSPHILKLFQKIARVSMTGLRTAASHPLARETRLQLVVFALHVLRFTSNTMHFPLQQKFKDHILSGALSWFCYPPVFSFGGNRLQIRSELQAVTMIINLLRQMTPADIEAESTYAKLLRSKQDLLIALLENEHARLTTWLFPVENIRRPHPTYPFKSSTDNFVPLFLPTAWQESPALAIQLMKRFQSPRLYASVRKLILACPEKVVQIPEALQIILGDSIPTDINHQLKYLLYWAPLDPISAAIYFLPPYSSDPFALQYAMRTLESHSVDATFFYVPQIVQALRWDSLGYVERFILETAKFSQLFAHQIIWNMKANAYKDEDSQVPDEVKPKLDSAMDRLIGSFSRVDRDFYEREFHFFGEVTSISGKLRPYIKKTKAEKKQKIDEELRKVKVDVGVYVPSNPDGVVIGIDRKSGRPLQSHAKAPFMATFRIRKTPKKSATDNEVSIRSEQRLSVPDPANEMWLSAIFKVGDDVRQDMLVLQIISAFRSIFNSVGLDVYVYPYRVLATAPGCGVIDLIPKSISRDMLGREAVNGLYDYFTTKYGGEDSIKFQEARNNFVKSMAAYSIISYLLQLKDRHNGNIMIEDAGHIIHIDFGFCFDIAPGGITFERAPFKLTAEMVAVMGGSIDSQPFHWYEELCIKAFLACRPYADKLASCVKIMSASGLPCFKPETIQNFKDRFVLEKNEKEAAEYVRGLVKKSYSSYTTKGYDQFQLFTNGIPY